eukprot:5406452-Amphidinium_carterae.1
MRAIICHQGLLDHGMHQTNTIEHDRQPVGFGRPILRALDNKGNVTLSVVVKRHEDECNSCRSGRDHHLQLGDLAALNLLHQVYTRASRLAVDEQGVTNSSFV